MAGLIPLPTPLDPKNSELLVNFRKKITTGLPPEQHLNAALKYVLLYKSNFERLQSEAKPSNPLHDNLELAAIREKNAKLKEEVDACRKMKYDYDYMKDVFTQSKTNLRSLDNTMKNYREEMTFLRDHIATLKASKIPLPSPIYIIKAKAEEKELKRQEPEPDNQVTSVSKTEGQKVRRQEPELKTDSQAISATEAKGEKVEKQDSKPSSDSDPEVIINDLIKQISDQTLDSSVIRRNYEKILAGNEKLKEDINLYAILSPYAVHLNNVSTICDKIMLPRMFESSASLTDLPQARGYLLSQPVCVVDVKALEDSRQQLLDFNPSVHLAGPALINSLNLIKEILATLNFDDWEFRSFRRAPDIGRCMGFKYQDKVMRPGDTISQFYQSWKKNVDPNFYFVAAFFNNLLYLGKLLQRSEIAGIMKENTKLKQLAEFKSMQRDPAVANSNLLVDSQVNPGSITELAEKPPTIEPAAEGLKEVMKILAKLEEEAKEQLNIEEFSTVIDQINSQFDEHSSKFKTLSESMKPLSGKILEIEEHIKYLAHRDEAAKKDLANVMNFVKDFEEMYEPKITKIKDRISKIETNQSKIDKNLQGVDLFNEHLKNLMTYHELDKIIEKSKTTEDAFSEQYETAVARDTNRLAKILEESENKLRQLEFAEQQLKLAFKGMENLEKKAEKSRISKKSGYSERRQNVATQHYIEILQRENESGNSRRTTRQESDIQEVTNILLSSDWKKCVSAKYTESLLNEWSKKTFLSPTERKPFSEEMTMEQWDWQKNVNWRLHYRSSVVSRG